MAPELSRPAAYLGHAVDVWAFGCVMYEALHGYAPFRGETMEQLQLRIKKVSHEPLHRDLSTEVRARARASARARVSARADLYLPIHLPYISPISPRRARCSSRASPATRPHARRPRAPRRIRG